MKRPCPARLRACLHTVLLMAALPHPSPAAEPEANLNSPLEEQVAAVMNQLRRDGHHSDLEPHRLQSAYSLYHALFYGVMEPDRSLSPVGLQPAMLPGLLALSGHRHQGAAVVDDPRRVPLELVPMLSALRRDGDAESLDEIAADSCQGTTPRIIALLAMYSAGEGIDFGIVAEILNGEQRLHQRLICILMYLQCHDRQSATEVLLPLLEDRNAEVRAAAVYSIRAVLPEAGLEALTKLLHQRRTETDISSLLEAIAAYGGEQATQTIAEFLAESITQHRHDDVYDAIGPFATVTGQRFYEAGAHSREYYVEQARQALDWYRNHLREQAEAAVIAAARDTQAVRDAFVEQARECLEARALQSGTPVPNVMLALLKQPSRFTVRSRPWAEIGAGFASEPDDSDSSRRILYGGPASLDRVGECWEVVTPARFGVALVGCLEHETMSLMFLTMRFEAAGTAATIESIGGDQPPKDRSWSENPDRAPR